MAAIVGQAPDVDTVVGTAVGTAVGGTIVTAAGAPIVEIKRELEGFLVGTPVLSCEEALLALVDLPLVTRGYIEEDNFFYSANDVAEILEACNERLLGYEMKANYYSSLTDEETLSVCAFDVKLPKRFPVCVALSAAFASDPNRLSNLEPWKPYILLFYSAMFQLKGCFDVTVGFAFSFPGENYPISDAEKSLGCICTRDIAVSDTYLETVLPRKFGIGNVTTFWNPTSVALVGHSRGDLIVSPSSFPGFAWLESVRITKPRVIRFYLRSAFPRKTTGFWGRGAWDEHILIPPVNIRVTRVLMRQPITDNNGCKVEATIIEADVLPQQYRYDALPKTQIGGSDGEETNGFHRHDDPNNIGEVGYRGVIELLQDYNPPKSCQDHIRDDLPQVLPLVTNINHILRESIAVARSRLERLSANIPRLSDHEALAVTAYTFDLGFASANNGEDNLYVQLNNVLRERLPRKMQILKPYLCYLMRGLGKLPTYRGTVYRGLPASALDTVQEKYLEGSAIHWSGFTSTTTNINTARQFADIGGIIMHIRCQSGRSVAAYSAIETEEEILLSPNCKFIVFSECTFDAAEGYYKVELVERRQQESVVF